MDKLLHSIESTGPPSNVETHLERSGSSGDMPNAKLLPSGKPTEGMDSNTFQEYKAEIELARYLEVLQIHATATTNIGGWRDEIRMTPLFTWPVKIVASAGPLMDHLGKPSGNVTFEQYAVLGHELPSADRFDVPANNPIFLNTNTPWSAFICGSQGSGKSYTLACMLENCLLSSKKIGHSMHPLAGMLFHYDAHSTESVCEAAYLATHIPVVVLVSPSNYFRMKKLYESIPIIGQVIKVVPLLLQENHLNTQRMLRLMAFSDKDGAIPLYMEVIIKILKEMALEAAGAPGFKYKVFLDHLRHDQLFAGGQKGPMNLRLQILEGFMDTGKLAQKLPKCPFDIFNPKAGTLTIVDLTDPFVDPSSACVLFDICLALFLEGTINMGKVVALDEAHKFMNGTSASEVFTNSLLTVIREQRHKGARCIISTQEPTISPKLLDLCSMTFVHRFTSPEWLVTLKDHLAGASLAAGNNKEDVQKLFAEIVGLNVGESLIFAPSAMLDVADCSKKGDGTEAKTIKKLGLKRLKFKTRPRITRDGGQSIMATACNTNGNAIRSSVSHTI